MFCQLAPPLSSRHEWGSMDRAKRPSDSTLDLVPVCGLVKGPEGKLLHPAQLSWETGA